MRNIIIICLILRFNFFPGLFLVWLGSTLLILFVVSDSSLYPSTILVLYWWLALFLAHHGCFFSSAFPVAYDSFSNPIPWYLASPVLSIAWSSRPFLLASQIWSYSWSKFKVLVYLTVYEIDDIHFVYRNRNPNFVLKSWIVSKIVIHISTLLCSMSCFQKWTREKNMNNNVKWTIYLLASPWALESVGPMNNDYRKTHHL